MRIITVILFFHLLLSCIHRITVTKASTIDSTRVDSKYVKGTWNSYFKDVNTPLGKTVRLKLINDSCYLIQWGDLVKLQTYPDTFHLDGHGTWIPHYVAENKDYIVMRQGCGNPCWVGYFLPMKNSIKPYVIDTYLNFDLDNNLVASIKDSNSIEIINLKTNRTETHLIKGCISVFPGYCIDSLSIKNRILKYKWIPNTTMNSKVGTFKIERIEI